MVRTVNAKYGFIPITPTFKAKSSYVDLRNIANDLQSMWIDMGSADISDVLEQFKGILTGNYVIEYTSPNQAPAEKRIVSITVNSPGCMLDTASGFYVTPGSVVAATTLNNPPIIFNLYPDKTCPQGIGTIINWTANAKDPDGDQILYKFFLNDRPVTDWITANSWAWKALDAGSYRIEVQVRDGKHAGPEGMDANASYNFGIFLAELTASSAAINGISFSPDGNTLALGRSDGTIELLDIANSTEIRTLYGHSRSVNSIAFSPDGGSLASGSDDGTVKLWDITTGTEILTLNIGGRVNSVAFSPDGNILASGSDEGIVKLWEADSGTEIWTLGERYSNYACGLAFSSDGRTLATGSKDNTIKLWDIANGTKVKTLEVHSDQILSVIFSPNGHTLASWSMDHIVKLWDIATGTEIATLEPSFYGHNMNMAFSPDSHTLALLANDNIALWDLADNKIRILDSLSHPDPHGSNVDEIICIAFSPDGSTLVSGGYENLVKLWDVVSGRAVRTLAYGHFGERIVYSPDGSMLASTSNYYNDGTVTIWDIASRKEIRILGDPASFKVNSFTFSPNGHTLAAGNDNNTTKLWDIASGAEIRTFEGHTLPVLSVAFSPDGSTLATSSSDGTIKLWNALSGREINTLDGHSGEVSSVAFSPNGHIIAAGGGNSTIEYDNQYEEHLDLEKSNNTIILWDTDTGREIWTKGSHSGAISIIAFSPNGSVLASGSDDGTIKLWNTTNGDELRILANPSDSSTYRPTSPTNGDTVTQKNMNRVISISFSPDGHTMATMSESGGVTFWDINSGLRRDLACSDGSDVALSPDGHTFASANNDVIRLWKIA